MFDNARKLYTETNEPGSRLKTCNNSKKSQRTKVSKTGDNGEIDVGSRGGLRGVSFLPSLFSFLGECLSTCTDSAGSTRLCDGTGGNSMTPVFFFFSFF